MRRSTPARASLMTWCSRLPWPAGMANAWAGSFDMDLGGRMKWRGVHVLMLPRMEGSDERCTGAEVVEPGFVPTGDDREAAVGQQRRPRVRLRDRLDRISCAPQDEYRLRYALQLVVG